MRFTLVGLAAITTLLAACSSAPTKTAMSAAPSPAPAPSAQQTSTGKGQGIDTNAVSQSPINQTTKSTAATVSVNASSVLFDFDDYTVKAVYTALIQQQVHELQSQSGHRLTLQGNSDERGSVEYNLALGQKRADAVRKAMVLIGAPDDRIETISFGEEKPQATCHEESCWSQNRRVDFAYATKH